MLLRFVNSWFLLVYFLLSFSAMAAAPNTCPNGQHWVKAHHRRAYQRADSVFVSATSVKSHCSKNPLGYATWNEKLRNGPPKGWPLKNEVGTSWSEEEKERVLEAIGYLPPQLQSEVIEGLYRMKKSVNFPNAASGDQAGNISVYDSAFDTHRNLSQVITHELAHQVYRGLSPEDAEDYREAAYWWDKNNSSSKPNWVCLRKGFVEPDGESSPDEDFSNNVEYYLFNQSKLKAISPSAYDWIKAHFGANFKLGQGLAK